MTVHKPNLFPSTSHHTTKPLVLDGGMGSAWLTLWKHATDHKDRETFKTGFERHISLLVGAKDERTLNTLFQHSLRLGHIDAMNLVLEKTQDHVNITLTGQERLALLVESLATTPTVEHTQILLTMAKPLRIRARLAQHILDETFSLGLTTSPLEGLQRALQNAEFRDNLVLEWIANKIRKSPKEVSGSDIRVYNSMALTPLEEAQRRLMNTSPKSLDGCHVAADLFLSLHEAITKPLERLSDDKHPTGLMSADPKIHSLNHCLGLKTLRDKHVSLFRFSLGTLTLNPVTENAHKTLQHQRFVRMTRAQRVTLLTNIFNNPANHQDILGLKEDVERFQIWKATFVETAKT